MPTDDQILETRRKILGRLYDRYPRTADHLILDRRRIDRGMTDAGGLTRASAEAIGILVPGESWHLPAGWRRALEGIVVPEDAYRHFVRGRDERRPRASAKSRRKRARRRARARRRETNEDPF